MSITSVSHRTMNLSTGEPEHVANNAGAVMANPAPRNPSPAVSTPTVKTVRQLLADQQDMFSLADKLRGLTTWVDHKFSYQLNNDVLVPFVGSSHTLTSAAPNLATVITDLGYDLPQNVSEAKKLADVLEKRASVPLLRDWGGGLSWPRPMSRTDQHRIAQFLFSNKTGLPGLPLPTDKGVLDYLLIGSSVTLDDLEDPALALQKLLDNPKVMALGQALQAHLGGVSSDTSIYDYILTAIHLRLDQESSVRKTRNKIAHFDLLHPKHWGLAPSQVVSELSRHLVDKGRATPISTKLATHLLLATRAPHFLVKDIPGSVRVGSAMWTQLTIAAARIEAQTPGRVQNMTYAEVIAQAEPMATDTYANQLAQRNALSDWAVANGVLKPSETEHSAAEIQQAKTAYNDQLNALVKSSSLLETPVPSRKDIALEYLKAEFPHVDPSVFAIKNLQIRNQNALRVYAAHLTRRSMLDIVMEGEPLDKHHVWVTPDTRIPIASFNTYLKTKKHTEVTTLFDTHYEAAMKSLGDGHHEFVKQLVSNLPLADRKNFEYGEVKFFHTNDYKIAHDLTSPLELVNRARTMHVKTTLNGEVNVYEIDSRTGTIEKQNYLIQKFSEPYSTNKMDSRDANIITRRSVLNPYKGARDSETTEQPVTAQPPDSYRSRRTDFIADMYVKALALDGEDLLNHARGITSFDKGRALGSVIDEFFLNLIPFRSAIKNFLQGNTLDGVGDLAIDAFGLLTLGAGKAAQAVKVFGKGMSGLNAAAKATKAVKFLGAAAIEFLNPVGGLGDVLVGGAKLIGRGFAKGADAVAALRGASGSYDVLKAASKNDRIVATGTFKLADEVVEGGAVFENRKWYLLDPVTGPYGTALADFKPVTVAANGEINGNWINWLTAVVAPTPRTPNISDVLKGTLARARTNDLAAFNRGYDAGKIENIPGYYTSMNVSDLKELAISPGRTPEEIGSLAKVIETRMTRNSLEGARVFSEQIAASGGKTTLMPQNFYLSQGDLASNGECAALVNSMALAIQNGRQQTLIDNFFKASIKSSDPRIAAFRKQLNDMHQIVRSNFHGVQAVSQMSHIDISAALSRATPPYMMKIATQNHGLLAGAMLNSNKQKEWFFFDPNFGLATFASEAAMQHGIEACLNSGKTAGTLSPVAIIGGKPQFNVSLFNDSDFLMTVPYNNPYALFNAAL
ncbi:hypothetical protein [Pseudomonas trivialis]|uniref:Peptidase C58 YopT-type domain-containing protein n=1 Tax=Pseudomonas trivialis TaxID=200450 RepID=A0ABY0ULS7_9PSED|nr:hypothetical protein [Pseudomonas trivialis]SDS88054.1 hypothetical protein SAMN04490205_3950 [Pseudomonas trivialis]